MRLASLFRLALIQINLEPIWFERPDGSESYVLMKNGDAAVYKGCEREHWCDPLESKYGKWKNK